MSQTIAIFSPKGGVGRTFIATNLAASLAEKAGRKRTLLVDFDLKLPGDIPKLLDLKPRKALSELSREWSPDAALNFSQVHEFILHHPASGLDFLPIILNLKQNFRISEDFINVLLQLLSKEYEFIVIDAGSVFTKSLLAIFGNTNMLLFIVNPDLLSVSQVREAIDVLQYFSFPLRMMKVVLNRAESLGGVPLAEVKAALPCEIIARIPSDGKAVCLALNRRNPLVLDSPQSRSARQINSLAQDLISQPGYFISRRDLETTITPLALAKEESLFTEQEQLALPISATAVTLDPEERKKLAKEERITQLKQRIHDRVIQNLDLHRIDVVAGDPQKLKELKEKVKKMISNALVEETGSLIASYEERERFIKEMMDETVGLGPLEDLLGDHEISDILVNNKDQVYVEKRGKLELTSKHFASNEQVRQIIDRIIAPLGRRVDESVPMVDGRLSDGSRVNAIIPPLSLTGPTLTIRKFGRERLKINDLVRLNALTEVMADFIKACVLARKNIIVSGGTGSGKTTVLNVLSEFVPDGERIVTIEDAAELKLHHEHWVRLESRPPNIEGKGAITVRELFRNTLRMRPDRIIIGECRGLEALDMLQAMNTGHDGSMTTLHANATHDVLSRLDSLILMGGIEIPLRAIREMIASAIDVIVHTARLSDGSRKIIQVTEVAGMLDEMHIGLEDIFVFTQTGVNAQGKVEGGFHPTGKIPLFFDEIKRRGISISEEAFKPK
jgi:septum site-determining protein MinD